MASKVLVAGSGVIGLRTALELARRKIPVVLRSKNGPLHASTCSQGAGGLWMPFHCDDPRTDRWATETLDELHPIAKASTTTSNALNSDPALVELVPTIALFRNNQGPSVNDFLAADYKTGRGGTSPIPAWTSDTRLDFQHLTVEMLLWQNAVMRLKIPSQQELLDAGYKHAWFFKPPIVDSPAMLSSMLQEVQSHTNDIDLEMDGYESMEHLVEDARQLGCDAVVNCTSLGSAAIANDSQMTGARGILLQYDRTDCPRREVASNDEYGKLTNDATILTEEAPWGSETMPCYMIPRGNTIAIGGSYLEGDTESGIREDERARLLKNASRMGIDTTTCQPIGEWAGFRPYRNPSRCELDAQYDGRNENIRVVHSYGYGGSGWTVYVGAAREVASILESSQ